MVYACLPNMVSKKKELHVLLEFKIVTIPTEEQKAWMVDLPRHSTQMRI